MNQEYTPPTIDEAELLLQGNPVDMARILPSLRPGQFIRKLYRANTLPTAMEAYVEALRRTGVDIGKGGAQFGYRMPLPETGKGFRDLVIFRRN